MTTPVADLDRLTASYRALEQARAAATYANNLELVKRAIDPTQVAQQQFDAELARANSRTARGSANSADRRLFSCPRSN